MLRPIGSDISLGERVLECGEILSPSKIGLAASVGVDKVAFSLETFGSRSLNLLSCRYACLRDQQWLCSPQVMR